LLCRDLKPAQKKSSHVNVKGSGLIRIDSDNNLLAGTPIFFGGKPGRGRRTSKKRLKSPAGRQKWQQNKAKRRAPKKIKNVDAQKGDDFTVGAQKCILTSPLAGHIQRHPQVQKKGSHFISRGGQQHKKIWGRKQGRVTFRF